MKKEGKLFNYSVVFLQVFLIISLSFAASFLLSGHVGIVSATTGYDASSKVSFDLLDKSGKLLPGTGSSSPVATAVNPNVYKFGSPTGFGRKADIVIPKLGDVQLGQIASAEKVGETWTVTNTAGKEFTGITQSQFNQLSTAFPDPASRPFQTGKFLGKFGEFNGIAGHLVNSLGWALVVGGLAFTLGNIVGLDSSQTTALAASGAAATFAGRFSYRFFANKGFFGGSTNTQLFASAGVGLAIGFAIFALLYKSQDKQTVTFQCLPWEPPLGGANCEVCNDDPLRPCSEYRCRSLGQACDLVNQGTEEEACVWVSPNDVNSPTIKPVVSELSPEDLSYQPLIARPNALGTRIVKGSNGCLEAFTPLQFGLETDEPAQCKLDYEIKEYDEMRFFLGETNHYLENHTQIMRLPSPTSNNGSVAPLFQNDGTFSLYVQCQDANGNKNEDHYVVEFCVDKGPDTTPPSIEGTNINTGSPVTFEVDEVPVEVYTNEPAQCKWSVDDKPFDDMENSFSCPSDPREINANQVYPCIGNLTGVEDRAENNYYFRCRDNEGNTNVESFPFTLRGSQPLNILSTGPNSTVFGSTSTVSVDLEVITDDGSDEGIAVCFYNSSLTGEFIQMFSTDNFNHKQNQQLPAGTYDYNLRCVDAGGNIAEEDLQFEVVVDDESPRVVRTYRDSALKIVTDEDAECSYSLQSCNFNLDEGIRLEYSNVDVKNELFAPWNPGNRYHIKCGDDFGNQPDPNDCSAIVSPRNFFSEEE